MDRKQANDIEELQKEKAVSAQGGDADSQTISFIIFSDIHINWFLL